MKTTIISILVVLTVFSGCKKAEQNVDEPVNPNTIKKDVLVEFTSNVVYATYVDMEAKANVLYIDLVNFNTNSTNTNLIAAQQSWRDVRNAWEQSEGFLFGPVSIDNIDPRIDSWPIDFARIDSVLQSTSTLTPTYVDNLEESLKGFHPIEYLLWGNNGNKIASDFTQREKDFLVALADNLKTMCLSVKTSWNPNITGNYMNLFNTAGEGSTIYSTQRAAYEEMIDAMIGICDEVANGKIAEPLTQQNPALEESPFAKNSISDFTNNIISVQNVYIGKYTNDGKGLEDLIRANNLSMDGQIKSKINAAILSLNNITVPFGQAITSQQTQVQNSVDAINDLKNYLDTSVKPFVQTLVN